MVGFLMNFAVKCMYSLPYMLFVVLRYMNGVISMSHTEFFLSTEHTEDTEKIIVEDYSKDFR